MNINQYNQAGDIVQKINTKQAELDIINNLLMSISGVIQVKFNDQWIINMPSTVVTNMANNRKNALEQQLVVLNAQLNGI